MTEVCFQIKMIKRVCVCVCSIVRWLGVAVDVSKWPEERHCLVGLTSRITEKLEKQQKLEQERKKRQKHQVSPFGHCLVTQCRGLACSDQFYSENPTSMVLSHLFKFFSSCGT